MLPSQPGRHDVSLTEPRCRSQAQLQRTIGGWLRSGREAHLTVTSRREARTEVASFKGKETLALTPMQIGGVPVLLRGVEIAGAGFDRQWLPVEPATVSVLFGRNGSGKTHALQGVARALGALSMSGEDLDLFETL